MENRMGANLLMVLLLAVCFGLYVVIKWIRFHFNGLKSQHIFCKHKEEDREYFGSFSFGIFGSKFQKFECKKCRKKFEAQGKSIISKVT